MEDWLTKTIRDCNESYGINTFISGGALGVDQWAAEAVVLLREEHPDIKLIIARPFPSQADKWPWESRMDHARLEAGWGGWRTGCHILDEGFGQKLSNEGHSSPHGSGRN